MRRLINSLILLNLAVSGYEAHLLFRRDGGPVVEPARAAVQFSLELLNKIQGATRNNTKNIVYSPWSIYSTLSMLQLGLSDKTPSQGELDRLLNITSQTQMLHHKAMSNISNQLDTGPFTNLASSELKFIQANKILFNKNIVRLNPNYSRNLSKYYDASIEPFVLGTPNEFPVHERVNQWINKTTCGTIQNIADSSLASDPDLALVLLNAAYFKGHWLHIFNTTKLASFYNEGNINKRIDAVFMDIKGKNFDYAEFGANSMGDSSPKTEEEKIRHELTKDINCSVLVLPYNLNGGKDFSMMLILPDELDGINYVQSKLSYLILDAILKTLKSTMVSVTLPKFDFETTIEIPPHLKSMNVNSIFTASHDFKEMFDSGKQFAVDKITHKSRIKVDEKGTEAAGATLMTIFKKVGSIGPRFTANRPFIFMIRHNKSKMPLFIGRVNTVKKSRPQSIPFEIFH